MKKSVKVEMLVSIAGLPDPQYGLGEFGFGTGQIVELHPDLARAWIACGHAKSVEPVMAAPVVPMPETTSLEPPETAVLPEGKPKKASRVKESEQ